MTTSKVVLVSCNPQALVVCKDPNDCLVELLLTCRFRLSFPTPVTTPPVPGKARTDDEPLWKRRQFLFAAAVVLALLSLFTTSTVFQVKGPPTFPFPTGSDSTQSSGTAKFQQLWSYLAIKSGVPEFPDSLAPSVDPPDPVHAIVALERSSSGSSIDSLMDAAPLYIDSVRIVEWRHPKVGIVLAKAVCPQGKPGIVYDESALINMSLNSFRFVRTHEYAHFKASHVVCPADSTKTKTSSEMDADCMAAQLLKTDPEGRSAVVAYQERLRFAPQKPWGGYPLPKDRIAHLERCYHM